VRNLTSTLTIVEEKINISLAKNEALVFEFLTKFNKMQIENVFEDQSEKRVLLDIECLLEKELSEPFNSNYPEIINKARASVRDKE
jgi:hypothetical protein